MKTAIIHARIEPETKRSAEGVLKRLGLSPTEAIRMFYRQITMKRGIPFDILIPNDTTATTLRKAQRGVKLEHFDKPAGMFASWKK